MMPGPYMKITVTPLLLLSKRICFMHCGILVQDEET